jgi:predicted phage terminase large subunit-like protein
MDELTKERCAEVVRQRRLLRADLVGWCRHCGFEPARHHRFLLGKLEELARGKGGRLAIFMPPGSAKSTYGSILFLPWYFALYPKHQVITASHTAELAEKWGRRVRNLIAEHHRVLDYNLSGTNQAAGRWETNQGGEYFAAGVGGAIAGWRGDLVVIDDPVRSREDAQSKPLRDKTWNWYRTDVYPRLKPGGRIALIQTRWHEDDLAGKILADREFGGDQWEVISLPALAEKDDALGRKPGEALWPEWEPLAELERKRKAMTASDWNALFMQRPAPEEGGYFQAHWLKPYDVLPKKDTLRVYGASDYAVTGDGGDYTVHMVVGLDPDGRMYLLDVWRQQATPDRWVEAFCDLVKLWKPMAWAEEQGHIRSGIGPFLERRQRERSAYVAREQFPTRGDKEIRAQSIRGRIAMDGLYVPERAQWYPALQHELLTFPDGKHDDQVDALGLVGQLLDQMLEGMRPAAATKRDQGSGYRPTRPRLPQAGDWMAY